jgi:hypothetical protein
MNKFFISFLFFLRIYFSLSDEKDDNAKREKEQLRAERKYKTLACSILANTHYAYSNITKKQVKELLIKNNIINRSIDAKEKIPEFLTAICFKKIDIDEANDIIEGISEKRFEIINENDYSKLFVVRSDLNFTRIKNTMNRVHKIMKQIKEEDRKRALEDQKNKTKVKPSKGKTGNGVVGKAKMIFKNFGVQIAIGILACFLIIIITSMSLNDKGNKKEKDNKKE